MRRGIDAYRQTEAQSRSPLELVVMLYDGALRFAGEAQRAQATHRPRERSAAISRVLAILGELQSTLDLKGGGAVAAELDRLYTYMQGRLLDVSTKDDGAALEEVARLLTTLREGWAQIAIQTPAAAGPAR